MNYRGAWQQALSVLGRNTSRTAPVRNQSPALYWHLAGSCSKILPSAQAGLSGQMPAQTLSVMSVTGLQSGVGSPATTGPKRSVPFLRLARPKSPHQNRKAVRPTATLPHCLKRILTISLALNLILRPLYSSSPRFAPYEPFAGRKTLAARHWRAIQRSEFCKGHRELASVERTKEVGLTPVMAPAVGRTSVG